MSEAYRGDSGPYTRQHSAFDSGYQMGESLCSQMEACALQENSHVDKRNVCRILVNSRTFCWAQPPNRSNNFASGTGTGFVVDDEIFKADQGLIYVLTAYHVVESAIQISVYFDEVIAQPVQGVLVGANPWLDVAVVQVPVTEELADFRKDPKFGFKIPSDRNAAAVGKMNALGYALGKPHMQKTEGIVSGRITMPSRLQVDVAVNPGNSGGPLIDKGGHVVGIVTSGMSNAQNINYAAPIAESMMAFSRILTAAKVAPRIFNPKDSVSIIRTRVTLTRHPTRGVPLVSKPVEQRRLLDLADSDLSGESDLIDVGGARFYNAPLRPLLDQSPTLNAHYALANRVLLKTTRIKGHEGCDGGIFINATHPQTPQSLCEEGDRYEVVDGRLVVFKSAGYCMVDLRDVGAAGGEEEVFEPKGVVTADMARRTTLRFRTRGAVFEAANRGSASLEPTDVLNKIDGVEIDEQMRIQADFWVDQEGKKGKLSFSALLDQRNPGEMVRVGLQRKGEPVEGTLVIYPNVSRYARRYPELEDVPYLCRGGVIVMEATPNHLKLYGPTLHALMDSPPHQFSSMLIVTSILPESPFKEFNTVGEGDILVALNNHRVSTLEELARAWRDVSCGARHVQLQGDKVDARIEPSSLIAADPAEVGEVPPIDLIALEEAQADEVPPPGSATRAFRFEGDRGAGAGVAAALANTGTILRLDDRLYYNGLREGAVHMRMRDGSISSAFKEDVSEADARIRKTYGAHWVTG